MNITKKDLIVIGIFVFIGAVMGGLVVYLAKPSDIIYKQENVDKYRRANDSLVSIIKADKDSISSYYKLIGHYDSLMLVNKKAISHDKNLIKNFTVDSRRRYLDSLFKVAGK